MLSVTDPAPVAPCPAPFNLARHVLAAAEARPDHVALQIVGPAGAERWSYGRLSAAVRGVAAGLGARGLKPGDRVLLRLGNGVAFPLGFLGAVAGGFVPVPTAAGLTAGEVARLCEVIRPSLIVAGAGVALPEAPPCPVLPEDVLRGFEGLAEAGWAMGDPDRLGYIVLTSGTSGSPRAVAHAHAGRGAGVDEVAGLQDEELAQVVHDRERVEALLGTLFAEYLGRGSAHR